MHTAIFDVTNLMYISAAAVSKNIKYDKGATVEDIPKMVLHSVLLMMLKWKTKLKTDNAIAINAVEEIEKAQLLEITTIENYKNNGWKILNRREGGGLGGYKLINEK
jgi:predicted transcriptional regulator